MLKQKSKKFVSAVIAASLTLSVAAAMSGCSKSNNSSSASSEKLSGSITVAGWNDAYTSLKAEAEAFMKKNPGTTVKALSVDSNYTKLYSELAANSGVPDVVQMQNRDLASFVNKYPNAWLDVSDLIKGEESNFSSYVLGLVKVSGKYYAVPWDLGPCGLYYRTDIFKDAGIDINTIKTYDDYITAGQKISSSTGGKTKLLGFDYSGSTSVDVLMLLFNQLGGKYYASDGKVNLDSKEMVQAVNLMKKMISANVTINLANEWNDRITATENNQIATIPYAVWYGGTLKNSNADQKGKWGIAPLPAFTAGGNTEANLGGSVLAISSNTKNSALAKAFVKFALMSSEGNKINLESASLFTSYTKSYADSEYKATDDYFGVSIGQKFASYSKNIPTITYGPYYTDVNNALKTAVGEILLKNMDPDKALKDATSTAQKAIDNE